MFGTAFIAVLHSPDDDLGETTRNLGDVRYDSTHHLISFGVPMCVSIYKAPAATARAQLADAVWVVGEVFSSKRAALAYIREKEEYT